MKKQINLIKEEIPSIKKIKDIKKIPNYKETNKNDLSKEVITTLPEWSIEPPLKINRGQK